MAFDLLKETTSRCQECGILIPARVLKTAGRPSRVEMHKSCPSHGDQVSVISSDARFYWLAKGNPENAGGCCGAGQSCEAAEGDGTGTLGANAAGCGSGSLESLATCLALIEVVDSCNLACPTCYADSPAGSGSRISAPSLEDLQGRIQAVIDRKGGIEILQLSGGEPTLHPRFLELLAWCQEHPRIDYVLINTNGVRLAKDDAFFAGLAEACGKGGVQLYLQFDGIDEAGQELLRGADLRDLRQEVIERCGRISLPITLAMTVIPENIECLWRTVVYGLGYSHIRGISFQPKFGSGRGIGSSRLNTADIILGLVEQSGGQLGFDDFTPLPCGDPNCATIGYLLKTDGGIRSISEFVNFREVQEFLQTKIRYQPEDLARCGCDNEPLGDLLKNSEMDASHTFRLFIKPFMDSFSWDQDRIDRCCTHVIRPDGALDSFCRYYHDKGAGQS